MYMYVGFIQKVTVVAAGDGATLDNLIQWFREPKKGSQSEGMCEMINGGGKKKKTKLLYSWIHISDFDLLFSVLSFWALNDYLFETMGEV